MIKVTEKAKDRITELKKAESGEDKHLRVSVTGGGCSGLMYNLSFDHIVDTDQIFEDNQVKILVDKKSLLYLLGTTLDLFRWT